MPVSADRCPTPQDDHLLLQPQDHPAWDRPSHRSRTSAYTPQEVHPSHPPPNLKCLSLLSRQRLGSPNRKLQRSESKDRPLEIRKCAAPSRHCPRRSPRVPTTRHNTRCSLSPSHTLARATFSAVRPSSQLWRPPSTSDKTERHSPVDRRGRLPRGFPVRCMRALDGPTRILSPRMARALLRREDPPYSCAQSVPPRSELQASIPAGRSAVSVKPYQPPTPAFGPGSVEHARRQAELLELEEDNIDLHDKPPASPSSSKSPSYAGAGSYF